ncbi:MAG TPA: hypothetical protein VIV15_13435 [Anaerolineales bacterium]
MNETDALREKVQRLRGDVVRAQHALIEAERELYRARFQAYEKRLERWNAENPGPVDNGLWWEQVRPMCEDCQQEISRPAGHSLTMAHGGPPILCCGHSFSGGTRGRW